MALDTRNAIATDQSAIMQDISTVSSNDDNVSAKWFANLIEAVGSVFMAPAIDGTDHIARGLLIRRGGDGCRATISYDRKTGILSASVILGRISTVTISQMLVLSRIQSNAQLTRTIVDEEQHLLGLYAGSICPRRKNAVIVMRGILKDLRRVLSDDRHHVILTCQQDRNVKTTN